MKNNDTGKRFRVFTAVAIMSGLTAFVTGCQSGPAAQSRNGGGIFGQEQRQHGPEIGAQHPAAANPSEALRELKDGNARFAAGETRAPSLDSAGRRAQAESQAPFAIVLGCADSRAPVEMIFDQNPGNLFVVRVAGNLADPVTLGSIEYAVANLEPSLLIVMGHEGCGAIEAAQKAEEETEDAPENVQYLVQRIRPVVANVLGDNDAERLQSGVIANVQAQIRLLLDNEVVSEGVRNGDLQVLGAYYEIGSGRVAFLDEGHGGTYGGSGRDSSRR